MVCIHTAPAPLEFQPEGTTLEGSYSNTALEGEIYWEKGLYSCFGAPVPSWEAPEAAAASLSLLQGCPCPSQLPFPGLTFHVPDADAVQEHDVLVGHLPHHAGCLKECLGKGREITSTCCSRGSIPRVSHIQSTTEQQHIKIPAFGHTKGQQGRDVPHGVPKAGRSWIFSISPFPTLFKKLSMYNNHKENTCQGNVSVAGVQDFEQDSDLFFILISFVLIILEAEHP